MTMLEIRAQPIDGEAFSPYGEIIEKDPASQIAINEGRFDRFQNLATVDAALDEGCVNISIFRCRVPSSLPLDFTLIERHPAGSQAFMPLAPFPFFVVVAPPGDDVNATQLRAFVTNGHQGVNLHRGVWHLPLIGRNEGEEYLVIDRGGGGNCDEYRLPAPVRLQC
jgi:ureidoglycolate lyase